MFGGDAVDDGGSEQRVTLSYGQTGQHLVPPELNYGFRFRDVLHRPFIAQVQCILYLFEILDFAYHDLCLRAHAFVFQILPH